MIGRFRSSVYLCLALKSGRLLTARFEAPKGCAIQVLGEELLT
jgi:hypothetical protein